MNNPDSFIDTYGIEEVHADAVTSQSEQATEFFVYKSEEIPVQEKMFRPARSIHFAIHLNLGEGIEIKYNLIKYVIQKNSLFIIHPGIVHVLKEVDHLPTISMGFSHDFLGAAMMHKSRPEVLGFLIQKSDPLFLLTGKEAETFLTLMLYLKNLVDNNEHPFKEDMIHHGFNLFCLSWRPLQKNTGVMRNME
ncbi:MAG TPA: hypothetical protein VGP55_07500 [Chitinophagaceae bacterium]|nr:hypothetical protein [Chitinophagaceae bacterium]